MTVGRPFLVGFSGCTLTILTADMSRSSRKAGWFLFLNPKCFLAHFKFMPIRAPHNEHHQLSAHSLGTADLDKEVKPNA